MSIKDRLTQSGSNLAEKRKQYESMLGEVKALKEVIQQKEEECTALEAELGKSQDPQVALTEELTQQSSQFVRRIELYYNAVESGALQEGAAQKDHRLMLVYRDEKDLRESLEQAHNKAQYREGQRKSLKEKLSLEIIVAKERIGERINTAVICPVNVKDYRDYVRQQKGIYKDVDKPGEFAELLLNWIATSFVQAKVQPQSGEYNGFWKATIPGTPELKFDSELPDEFKEASINVEAVVLGEKEFVLGGEAVVGKAGVPEESKVYLTAPKAAEIVGVTSRTIHNYIAQGKIIAERSSPNSAWRVDRASLDAYLVSIGRKITGSTSTAVVTAESKMEGIAVEKAGEYTLSNGMKVNPSEKYTTGQVAEFLGYAGGSSVLYVIGSADERKKKGLPLLAGEVQFPEGDTTRKKKTLITGQSIIDFDEQVKSKRKDAVTVTPAPKSVDDIVQPDVPKAGVGEKASARTIIVPDQETFNIAEIAVVLGVSYSCAGDLVKNHPNSEQWKVKGQSKTGYVFKNIPRAVVEEFAEKYHSHHRRKISQVTIDSNLIGVVGASRYLAGKLKECGVEYALSSIGMGTPARTYANKYLNHQPGLKLPAERDEKNRILVRRDSLDDFVDEYVKEEVIKPKVRAGESYEEITATLPDKYHTSVNAFIAHRSQGDYKKGGKKTKPVASLDDKIPPAPTGNESDSTEVTLSSEQRDYYTIPEAGALLNVSLRLVQRRAKEGRYKAKKVSSPEFIQKVWQIDKQSLDAYLVKTGKKPAEIAKPVSVEVPVASSAAPLTTSVEQPARPSLPEGELKRRYDAIESTLGKAYASRIKANTDIGDIEPEVFDETYLPLLSRMWSKIRTIYPTGIIPDELSPICRSSIFGNPERLAKLEEKVDQDYLKLVPKPADKSAAERAIDEKVDLIRTYTGLNEQQAKELLPNLDSDGGVDRIDALEKVLAGVAGDKLTDAATKLFQTNVGILIANFDFGKYRTKLASTLEKISSEYTGEIPDFYNPLKTPQNFTDVGALENVARVLKKARAKKGRSVGSVVVSPDRAYYAQYASGTAKAVEDDGFNLGMVCAIVDRGLNVSGRKGFAGNTLSAEVLKKKVSGFYNGKFDKRVYENNLRRMITCGAMLERDRSGKSAYSLATKLPDSVPASIREVLQPFYR